MSLNRLLLWIVPLCGLTLLAGAEEPFAPERFAPQVTPELIYVGSFGGQGDQWFEHVRITERGDNILVQALSGGRRNSFGAQVTLDENGAFSKVNAAGNPNNNQDVPKNHPNGGKLGPVSYGYNQVHAILQQPFMKGPGWELWNWRHAQAKATDNMADSRLRHAFLAPNKDVIGIGWTDGGNSVFRRHPKDLKQGHGEHKGIGYNQTSGGGAGTSNWVFRVNPQNGEVTGAMVFRGLILNGAWDEWGRFVVVGGGVFKPRSGLFPDYGDGAGAIMVSRDWKNLIFKAHVAGTKADSPHKANGQAWGVALDSEKGLLAICGWVDGPIINTEKNDFRYGGDKDAFIAVVRLWSPEDYEQAKEREAAATSDEDE